MIGKTERNQVFDGNSCLGSLGGCSRHFAAGSYSQLVLPLNKSTYTTCSWLYHNKSGNTGICNVPSLSGQNLIIFSRNKENGCVPCPLDGNPEECGGVHCVSIPLIICS
ncbi:hypothetical protein JRQ81_014580 [Phrynocephalus forsythii]|uniref:Uncharacterized protein n=1 Tax=Phrynocephalus forsythii TaxID=171643 RepID=A0A9Q1B3M8_9SAUR|nr:hypothetical protein JRQ81_014580 [Phrynocephalus forsythii]